MNPATAIVIAEAADLAIKGSKWGYGKWRAGRVEQKCIRTIMDAVPESTSRQDLRQARCAARMYCNGKTKDITEAVKVCRINKKGR